MSALHAALDDLTKELLTMGSLVEDAVRKASFTLVERRPELVDEILAGDKKIDALENTIDKQAYNLLALHQPVADDLRLILMALTTTNELERIGDHAKNIAKASRKLANLAPLPLHAGLQETSDRCVKMLSTSLDALIQQDADLARSLRDQDQAVDDLCDDLTATISTIMQEDSNMVPQGILGLRVVQNLERIGDLANNIAKDLLYYLEGEIVRHGGRLLP